MGSAQTDTISYGGQEEGEKQFEEKHPSVSIAKLRPSQAEPKKKRERRADR